MEKQYDEVAARAVLAYLYDHDMYSLAEQFCMANPYLRADQSAPEKGLPSVSFLHKPLRDVLKEFIVMQSQLLQLVNLCSSVIEFPVASSVLVLADHLIHVMKTSGTAEVLKTVISTIPACTDWSVENSPTAPTPDHSLSVTGNSTSTLPVPPHDGSYSAGSTLLGQEIIITSSDMNLIETLTRCVNSTDSSVPIIVENAVFSGPPAAVKGPEPNRMLTVENVPPSCIKQSTVQQTTSTATVTATAQSNQPTKQPPQHAATERMREHIEQPSTSIQPAPPSAADGVQPVPTSVPNDGTHRLPSSAAGSTLDRLTNGAARSNATPLDNPIVPGTVSSRSTSSRKRSHIRILDFGTPPFKRGSPSTVGRPSPVIPSPALLNVPKRAVPLDKQQPVRDPRPSAPPPQRSPQPPPQPPPVPAPAPAPNDAPKPKKMFTKLRIVRCGVRRQGKRINGTKLCSKRPAARVMPKSVTLPPAIPLQPTTATDTNQPINLCKRSDPPSGHKCYPSLTNLSTAKKHPLPFRPPSASPPRSIVPDSPACPIDPLALCPMTPRFLTRPLQPLCMLSPLLGTLDLSCTSQVKSVSHSKPATDINTPGYPITPGNAITPSPPPTDSVSYYEGAAGDEPRTSVDEAYDSASDHHQRSADGGGPLPGAPKPLLTLATNGEEIAIRYDERTSFPLRVRSVQEERDHAAQLASRIEIDDGNGKVFQIAVSPLQQLYEHVP